MAHGERRASIIVDLGFGDAGKGTIVDTLVRRAGGGMVVRFNGGAQAGHNVVAPDGRHHTFSQFGSGMFVPEARTHLSEWMILHPLAMLREEEHLRAIGIANAFERTTLDERALVITPFHQAANRLRELTRGNARHGSCGIGVGETVMGALQWGDALRARDLRDRGILLRKLRRTQELVCEGLRETMLHISGNVAGAERAMLASPDVVEQCAEVFLAFASRAQIIDPDQSRAVLSEAPSLCCEGAQGVLIDEWHGFHPYTTWSTTTSQNARALLHAVGFDGSVETLGVVRAYATRHGVGPFVTEDAKLATLIPDHHNVWGPWQRGFRIGWFDAVATKYAIEVDGHIDRMVVTNLDRLRDVSTWYACDAYQWPDATIAKALAVVDPPDLLAQERRTQRLFDATPVYITTATEGTFESRVAAHLRFLEERLGIPIWIASLGPRASDKQFLGSGARAALYTAVAA